MHKIQWTNQNIKQMHVVNTKHRETPENGEPVAMVLFGLMEAIFLFTLATLESWHTAMTNKVDNNSRPQPRQIVIFFQN